MAEAWSGVLFERFSRYRPIVAAGLAQFGEAALAAHPPAAGDRVLDLGCGWGETTRRLGELVGEAGSVLGVDLSPPFVAAARREAEEAGAANVDFRVEDAQEAELGGPFDFAFSRMGIMFFADPVRAPAPTSAARCGPAAGWSPSAGGASPTTSGSTAPSSSSKSTSTRCTRRRGADPSPGPLLDGRRRPGQRAADAGRLRGGGAGALRPADQDRRRPRRGGRVQHGAGPGRRDPPRVWGERAEELRPTIAADLRAALADLVRPDGVWAPASTWIISARAPER